MILVDTSAWIEYLRATGSASHQHVRAALAGGQTMATTEPVVMEILSGARSARHLEELRGLLRRCTTLPVGGLATYEDAAALFRQGRRSGLTVRSLTDCLIAAVAIREGIPVLHSDRDFDALTAVSGLKVVDARGREVDLRWVVRASEVGR